MDKDIIIMLEAKELADKMYKKLINEYKVNGVVDIEMELPTSYYRNRELFGETIMSYKKFLLPIKVEVCVNVWTECRSKRFPELARWNGVIVMRIK